MITTTLEETPTLALAAAAASDATGCAPAEVRQFSTGVAHYVFEALFADAGSIVVRMGTPTRRDGVGVPSIAAAQPVHVTAWIEAGTRDLAAPSVKQRLAARHLFDWLVNGQVVPVNPAHTVRGPRHVVTSGLTPARSRGGASVARQH
jgi:hypothetical protein